MNYNIKLNIKSIIKFEQLTNKPFSLIDYTSEEDVSKLLYCIVLSNNDCQFTYSQFLQLLDSKKISKNLFEQFQTVCEVFNQFKNTGTEEENTRDTVEGKESRGTYVKDLAALLVIQGGLDVNYVLNELSLNDIPLYIQALNDKQRERMEEQRLWTFISILPHVDSKKLKTPADLYPFPWELKEKEIEREKHVEEGVKMLDNILDNKELLDKIMKTNTTNNG
jgi:hypothetical protein bacD2_23404|nr:MAG TPA: hypothetical protein [Caudoviricetes sp.]